MKISYNFSKWFISSSLLTLALFISTGCFCKSIAKVVIYPMPASEVQNNNYKVSVNGKPVPVYNAKIGATDPVRRFKAVDDIMHSSDYYDTAAFSYFDLRGTALVSVKIPGFIRSVKVLPSALNIHPQIRNNQLILPVSSSQNLTIEINGETVKSLHLFINPIEANKPNPKDPNVIFYGPGIHTITSLIVGDNKTVYLAGGAILNAVVGKDEKFGIEPSGLKNYAPTILLMGNNIKLCGRGILDAGSCPTHARNLVTVFGKNITIEGIILRNSSGWTVPVRQSDQVTINNIKILGYRANTDGIDICNSRNVTVQNCFLRTNDDLIVVKSWEKQGDTKGITVKHCVLWNQLAHALSLGAELREDVSDVLFTDCDIIHDQGREWSLRVFHTDASVISNIRFTNIRIEESRQLISLWTGKNVSSYNKQLGYIKDISFSDITAKGNPLVIALTGGDAEHIVENVTFKNIFLNGKVLKDKDISRNPFVKQVTIL
jgi:polygalacturonase